VAVNLLQLLGRMLKTALGYADLPPVIGNHISLQVKPPHRQCNDLQTALTGNQLFYCLLFTVKGKHGGKKKIYLYKEARPFRRSKPLHRGRTHQ
jgi:hypothetical protein